MAIYQLKTFADIYTAVMEELKISTTDTVSVKRIKRDINVIYDEIISERRWWWTMGSTTLQLRSYVSSGTASVTQNSAAVTLSGTLPDSKRGYYFSVDGHAEIYPIESHAAGSASLSLSDLFTGSTNATATYKIWTDRLPLPVDCKETVEVWHDHHRTPLTTVGPQEFRRMAASAPRAEGKPTHYATGDFKDPTQTSSIASLPALSTRASSGVVKTLVFASTLPSSVTAGKRLRLSGFGHPAYNGDITVSSVSGSTLTYTGRAELEESATADASASILALDQESSSDRYRELMVWPSLSQSSITLHVDYAKHVAPLENDDDEPALPREERVVLLYGALSRAWARERNPEEAARNKGLYEQRLARMAGKLADSFDNPQIAPAKSYLAQKRAARRGVSAGDFYGVGGGGGPSGALVTGAANTVAVFDSLGSIASSATVSTTELNMLDGVSSNVQTQLDAKAAAADVTAEAAARASADSTLQTQITANASAIAGKEDAIAAGTTSQYWRGDKSWQTLDTDAVTEGTNLYFTDARVAANSTVAANTTALAAATSSNTASTIVKRDGSGNFSAGTITATLNGNATSATTATTATSATTAGNVTGTVAIANGGTGQTTQQAAMNALAGTQSSGKYLRSDGTNTTLSNIQAADVPTLNQNTTGTASNVTGTVAIANGGTGQTTQQAAINALTGTQSSGKYLRSDGTNATLASIQAADVPTLNQNTTGTASNVTGTVAIANGGTGQTSASAAINALLPSQSGNSGLFLTTNGSAASWGSVGSNIGVTAVKTANYTITSSDDLVLGDSSGGAFTFTLPAASTTGKVLRIKKTDSGFNAITVSRAGSDTIEDNTTGLTSTTLNTIGETIILVSNGTSKWYVIERSYPSVMTSYTPTLTNWGTSPTTNKAYWKREGDSLLGMLHIQTGTALPASAPTVTFPGSLTIDSTKIWSSQYQVVGQCVPANTGSTFHVLARGGDSTVSFSYMSATTNISVNPQAASTLFGAGVYVTFWFKVPITGWN